MGEGLVFQTTKYKREPTGFFMRLTTEVPMISKRCTLTCIALVTVLIAAPCLGQESSAKMLKAQERYTLSLELEFTKKDQNPLEHAISVLFDVGPNGYATGFLVGNGLVMTAYHVISGNLSGTKKVMLG